MTTAAADSPGTLPCAGIPVTICSPAEAADLVIRLATAPSQRGFDVHLCNAYTFAIADKDLAFNAMLQRSINLSDGKAVVWANRALNPKSNVPKQRVYGPNLFLDVFDLGQTLELRHYLLGSTPAVLRALEAELARRFPGVNIVGAESPPFRALSAEEHEHQISRLVSSGAQVVWVGLGTPKQDWEASRLAARVPAVFCAVGAAFDFVAGTKRQAPPWVRDSGLEWIYRLACEPRRLWRRYLFGNTRFIMAVLRHSQDGRRGRNAQGAGSSTDTETAAGTGSHSAASAHHQQGDEAARSEQATSLR